jgi:UDP-glucose 4-epimerase
MHALVTGGAGFIGSHVADALLSSGHTVTVLDDLSGGFEAHVPAGADFVRGSVTDAPTVDALFRDARFDVVYHLAAYAAEGLSPFIRRFNYTNNLIGTATIVNAAVNHGTRRIVFTSSIAVYGDAPLPMTETTIPRPVDPYGIAKYAAELDLANAFAQFGLEYVIFRPHNVYGERQHIADPYRNVVGIFMKCAAEGRPMPVFGDGSQTRAFSYIADVAPVIARAGELPEARNAIFNVGADTAISVRGLAERISALFSRPCEIETLPARHEVAHAAASHDRVRAVFAPPPPVPLDEGLSRMAAWVNAHKAGAPTPFSALEVSRGLPPSWAALAAAGPEPAAQ